MDEESKGINLSHGDFIYTMEPLDNTILHIWKLLLKRAVFKSSLKWKKKWRRKWQPTPVSLPGKSHGQRSLVGCSPWGCKESDTTERLTQHKECRGKKKSLKKKKKKKLILYIYSDRIKLTGVTSCNIYKSLWFDTIYKITSYTFNIIVFYITSQFFK